MASKTNNNFSLDYYSKIIDMALEKGYSFVTLNEFFKAGCPSEKHFILRHDVDQKPEGLLKILRLEVNKGVRSTNFIRFTANEYNPFCYPVFQLINFMKKNNFEIGVHTSCVEYAEINGLDPMSILRLEQKMLKDWYGLTGDVSLAPHRDLNYAFNSLPFIENEWKKIKKLGFSYQAYDQKIMDNVVYISEGFNPHLCWRKDKPEEVIPTKKSICMLTHNHWWYKNHPFERTLIAFGH